MPSESGTYYRLHRTKFIFKSRDLYRVLDKVWCLEIQWLVSMQSLEMVAVRNWNPDWGVECAKERLGASMARLLRCLTELEEDSPIMSKLPGRYSQFRKEFPAISRAYDEISSLTSAAGPLSEKMIQLVRLAMAIGSGQEGAVHSHTRRALEADATPDEIRQVGLAALTTLGFPRMMTGLSWIDDTIGGGLGRKRKSKANRRRS